MEAKNAQIAPLPFLFHQDLNEVKSILSLISFLSGENLFPFLSFCIQTHFIVLFARAWRNVP
jgi:hypothetical protein